MPKQQRNKYSVESANCNISPTRQRLLLLTGETGITCVCKAVTIDPPVAKTTPANYLPYLCVFDCQGEREGEVEFIYCQVMILFDQVSTGD